jgi:antitoxin component HigA of HigAB toxin-antitoxin module
MTATRTRFSLPDQAPETYEELCRLHLPRRIHYRDEYKIASKIVDWIAVRAINADQEDYASVMGDMVNEYEAEHRPQPERASGLEALELLMEEHGITARQLGEILGINESMGSKILNGQRSITVAHAKKLAKTFGVPATVFLDLDT